MHRGVCVKCEGTEIYGAKVKKGQQGYMLGQTVWSGVERILYACARCGYLEQYATGDGIGQLAKHGVRIGSGDA